MRVALADVQQWFWKALRSEPSDSGQWVKSSDEFGAHARMEWYAQMSMGRHLDALGSEFPVLQTLMGHDFHHQMAHYVRAHPTPHASLGDRGDRLPEFLRAHEQSAAASLAELEIARSGAFLAPEAEMESVEAIGALGQARFADAHVMLSPSLQRLSLTHDPTVTFGQYEAETPLEAPPLGKTHLAVWRQGDTLFHVGLAPIEARALDLAAEGHSLGEVCAVFGEDEAAVGAAFGALASWFNEGWIRQLSG